MLCCAVISVTFCWDTMDVMDCTWDISRTVEYITINSFERVALQFPDELLSDAPAVATELKLRLKGRNVKVSAAALGCRVHAHKKPRSDSGVCVGGRHLQQLQHRRGGSGPRGCGLRGTTLVHTALHVRAESIQF